VSQRSGTGSVKSLKRSVDDTDEVEQVRPRPLPTAV
jgi:hypothetical protein